MSKASWLIGIIIVIGLVYYFYPNVMANLVNKIQGQIQPAVAQNKFIGNWKGDMGWGVEVDFNFVDENNGVESIPNLETWAFTYKILNESVIRIVNSNTQQVHEYPFKFQTNNILLLKLDGSYTTFVRQ